MNEIVYAAGILHAQHAVEMERDASRRRRAENGAATRSPSRPTGFAVVTTRIASLAHRATFHPAH